MRNYYKDMNKIYFNKIAHKWDRMIYHDPQKLNWFFEKLSLKEGNVVLDVGTGTGILIPYILRRIGKKGKIFAIDISNKMIEIAKKRHLSPNIFFILGDVEEYEFKDILFDNIICYSVFPHFCEQEKTIKKLSLLLKSSGSLSVFHSASRRYINNIHRENGFHFEKNILPPAKDVADMMVNSGLSVPLIYDNDTLYLVIGKKK